MSRPAEPEFLAVGRIGRAHGVRGELQVDSLTDFPERFTPGTTLYVGAERGGERSPARLLGARQHTARWILHFEGLTDRDAARMWTGLYLFVPTDEARALGEDSYYEHQLIGLEVVTDEGRSLGQVSALMETGAADVLIVGRRGQEVLLPMIGEVIDSIDLAAGRITVTPLPGLLEDAPDDESEDDAEPG